MYKLYKTVQRPRTMYQLYKIVQRPRTMYKLYETVQRSGSGTMYQLYKSVQRPGTMYQLYETVQRPGTMYGLHETGERFRAIQTVPATSHFLKSVRESFTVSVSLGPRCELVGTCRRMVSGRTCSKCFLLDPRCCGKAELSLIHISEPTRRS